MKPESIIGIGIDQGIANCGYAVVELTEKDELKILASGTLVTKSTYPMSQRILMLHEKINRLVETYKAQVIGCEKLFFNPKSKKKGGRNKSASIVYVNMATGILYLIAGKHHIPLKEFVPGTVKKMITGNGRADKKEMEKAIEEAVLTSSAPHITLPFSTSHEPDAIGIGITAVKYFKTHKDELLKEQRHKKPRKKRGVK